MANENRLTHFGAPRYDVEASIAALLYWEPSMPLEKLSLEVERRLNYASPETRKRYRRAIIGALIPNDGTRTTETNGLALFVKMVEKRKARLEAIFYSILRRNQTLREICLYLAEEFEATPINRHAIRQFLLTTSSSQKGAYETIKKTINILRDFGLIQSQPEEKIIWRSPALESFAYILYDYYLSIGVVAPDINDVLANKHLRASFFHGAGIVATIQQGDGIWWNHERRPPLDRILFRFGSVSEFLDSVGDSSAPSHAL